ncbi:MAG: hypothetical protein ACJAXR_000476 [Halopseudomonas sp.]|jgi:hypothetical protein|uniref:Arm DNA-binding domain-containing protein n=1 Tax=Halopseudomonas sp. TaxID=2901191 RepID=UPI0039E341D9
MEVKADSRSLLALQPKPNPYKTAVGRGLYLLTMPNGSKLWRLKYYFERRERTLSIGAFPSITLAQAIKTRDEARAAIEAGTDPSAVRKAEKDKRAEQRAHAKAFRLVITLDHALTIETPRQILSLTPEQTAAVHVFLLAVDTEGTPHASDR